MFNRAGRVSYYKMLYICYMIVTEVKDYEPLIHKFYAQDKELIAKYHVLASDEATVKECAEHTIKVFKDSVCDFRFFKLSTEKDLIGYFGTEVADTNMLTGFFINPKYRKTAYIRKFWRIIDNHFSGVYFTGIYPKNLRGIKFIEKRGVFIGNIFKDNKEVLIYKMN